MTRDELLEAYKTGKRDFNAADLRGADLRNVYLRNAYLRGVDFRGVDFRGAYLRGAYLRGADLRGADLRGVDFRGADLCNVYLDGAYLGNQWIIQGPTRSDGYFFMLTSLTNEGPRIKAGCRNFTPSNAIDHWQTTRGGTPLGKESLAIVRHLVELAKIRGYDVEDTP